MQVKVILETCLLDERELISGVVCAGMAGADYVKTSTGFSRGGATVDDVALMHRIGARHALADGLLPRSPSLCAGDSLGLKVKASGGIGTASKAAAMLRAGASRLGASRGVHICEQSQYEGGDQAKGGESAY